MKLLPYDSFEIATTMSAEGVIAVLNDATEPAKWFRLSTQHRTFQGSITGDGFRITRIVHYRNSFLPVIRGRLRPGPAGVTIAVTMSVHPFVTVFMCVWFGGVGLGIVTVLASLASGQTKAAPILLIPFAMLLFGWTLVAGGFWFEARKAKLILVQMFKK